MRSVPPVFHVSMLELAQPNTIPGYIQQPPLPIQVDGDLEYEISQINNSKFDLQTRSKLCYHVKWLGYEGTDEEYSWLDATALNAPDLVEAYHAQQLNKPRLLEKVEEQLLQLKDQENLTKLKARTARLTTILRKPRKLCSLRK